MRSTNCGKSDYWLFLKLAFVGLLMNQVLFISGLKFTTVAHSALVVTFGPLFTLLFAWQRGQEKLTSTSLFGMALSICGIFFLNLDKNLNMQTAYLMGDLLTLGGSVAFAYYTVMSKHVAAKYGAVSATTFTYLAGACVFLPVGLPALVTLQWLQLPWGELVAFFYVAVLASVLAPLIFYYALRSMSASRLAALTYLQPVVTTISSVLILSEKLTLNFLIGGGIVLTGILLTQRSGQSAGASRVARQTKRRDSGQILDRCPRSHLLIGGRFSAVAAGHSALTLMSDSDETFRIVLIIGAVLLFPAGIYFRLKSQVNG